MQAGWSFVSLWPHVWKGTEKGWDPGDVARKKKKPGSRSGLFQQK